MPPDVAAAGCGTAAAGGGAAPAVTASIAAGSPVDVPVASVRITVPSETLSPTFTASFCTVPPSGAGTSIVALSDSRVTSGSSAFTVSPALTMISITGTSLKSPMSGTLISVTAMSPPRIAAAPRSHRPRIGPLGIEPVFGNRRFDDIALDFAVVGEGLQRCNRHVMTIDFEEAAELHAVIAAAEAVG